jgi:hypothetical protein
LFRSNPGELSVESALNLCSKMFLAYLKTDAEGGGSFAETVAENEKFIIRGTSFKDSIPN